MHTRIGRRLRWLALGAMLAPVACGILAGAATAAPGDLDASFGVGGSVVTDLSPDRSDRAEGVAIQPDGKILAVGAPSKLVRLTRDGEHDTTFDADGVVDTVIDGSDVTLQPDGRIVIGGTSGGSFALARYNADGSLDTSFGTDGKVTTSFSICQLGECATTSAVRRMAIAPDGKLVVAGAVTQTVFGSVFGYVGVARYTPDGAIDTAFGTGGTNFATADESVDRVGLALQADGGIVVGARKGGDFFLARFLGAGASAGALDPGFGTAGSTSVNIGGSDVVTDVALQGDAIVAAGYTNAAGSDVALARLRGSDGALDTGFGAAGTVTADLGGRDRGYALAVQGDGKLVVAGETVGVAVGSTSDVALARFTPDGAADASFGAAGEVVSSLSAGADSARDVALQPVDGKIVVAGVASPGSAGDTAFALARYDALAADLRVTASAAPDPVTTGTSLTYTLTVANAGPAAARDVRLTDSLSTRVSYASSTVSGGSCTPAGDGRSVSCAIGDLAAGASATAQITVTANRAGTAVNLAEVEGSLQDPAAADNAVETRTTIVLPVAGPPPSPSPSPSVSPGVVAPGGGSGVVLGVDRAPAKLSVARSVVLRSARRLSVFAPISRRASGRVRVQFVAAGRRLRFSAAIVDGRIRFSRVLSRAQARLGTGILTISYAGDGDTRPQQVRLRAASGRARLALSRPQIVDGRLRASGTVSARARGVVRVQVQYVVDGQTQTRQLSAPIADGRWSLDEALSAQVRDAIARRSGTVHSYSLFTGYMPARMRGEMRSYQILGNR